MTLYLDKQERRRSAARAYWADHPRVRAGVARVPPRQQTREEWCEYTMAVRGL